MMKIYLQFFLLALLLSVLAGRPAEAADVFSRQIGDCTLYTLVEARSDGDASILIGADEAARKKYVPDGKFAMSVCAYLLRTPDDVVLVDTGFGRNIFAEMASLDVTPDDVSAVLLTHMHGDHIGGLLREGGRAFPRAKVYLAEQELAYWQGGEGKPFQLAQDSLKAYGDDVVTFAPQELGSSGAKAVLPCLTPSAAFGHTPGHTVYMIESKGERLLIWGDLTHAMAIQMSMPEVSVTYDVDPVVAAKSRRMVLKYLADQHIEAAGMHVPYPGVGMVAADGDGFVFTSEPSI